MLTANVLANMFRKSYEIIVDRTDYLNQINVFPVADGDTGLNIAATLKSIVDELDSRFDDLSLEQVCDGISKGAFSGARGNAGVILSQFFVGFAKIISTGLDLNTFSNAISEGSKRAYKAVMDPKEGTILSVMKATSEAAKSKNDTNLKEMIEHCYETSMQSTLETPDQMSVLKKAKVVDSGALGFVYIIQGWLFVIAEYFEKSIMINMRDELINLARVSNISHAPIEYRYCTEAMLVTTEQNENELKTSLMEYGDSLLVISDNGHLKLHIHTNEPKNVITNFSRNGDLYSVKVDDMISQSFTTHS